jgi:hypothetical protein
MRSAISDSIRGILRIQYATGGAAGIGVLLMPIVPKAGSTTWRSRTEALQPWPNAGSMPMSCGAKPAGCHRVEIQAPGWRSNRATHAAAGLLRRGRGESRWGFSSTTLAAGQLYVSQRGRSRRSPATRFSGAWVDRERDPADHGAAGRSAGARAALSAARGSTDRAGRDARKRWHTVCAAAAAAYAV